MSRPSASLPGVWPGARVAAVVAHPDDETFACGALLAWLAGQDAVVEIVCATRGELGEVSDRVAVGDRGLGELREQELRAASDVLGVAAVSLLGYVDSGMDGEMPLGALALASSEEVSSRIAARVAGADLLVTFDASDEHRDHIAIREGVRAVGRALDIPVLAACLPRGLMRQWAAEVSGEDFAAAYISNVERLGTPDELVEWTVDATEFLERREKAMAEHASQVSPYEGLSPALYRSLVATAHVRRLR